MNRTLNSLFLLSALAGGTGAYAAEVPSYSGPESAAEQRFVTLVRQDVAVRFPTVADAERAGYKRYTPEDGTGAISYANGHWDSSKNRQPSQLWYDRHGRLLGADFSVPTSKSGSPNVWGVNPGRWIILPDHVHIVTRWADGSMHFGGILTTTLAKAGIAPQALTPHVLEKIGRVRDAKTVILILRFPRIYDLQVWIAPNPNGAFSMTNPAVKP
jgi:hypothetical protein